MKPANERIYDIVLKLTGEHETNNPNVIARNLGILVIDAPLEDVEGVFVKLEHRHIIILAENLKDNQLRDFVLAHELYHSIQHEDEFALYHNGHLVKGKKEREANQFATYLLLHDKQVRSKQSIYDVLRENYIPYDMADYI